MTTDTKKMQNAYEKILAEEKVGKGYPKNVSEANSRKFWEKAAEGYQDMAKPQIINEQKKHESNLLIESLAKRIDELEGEIQRLKNYILNGK